jgi:hypothetical protein
MGLKVIFVTIAVLTATPLITTGEIKNGYNKNIHQVINELHFLTELKNGRIINLNGAKEWDQLNTSQRIIIKTKIRDLKKTIKYYLVTEYLISEFNKICPEMIEEVSNIKNFDNCVTDIYLKVVPIDNDIRSVSGATYISRDLKKPHICISEYGMNTVSVKICAHKNGLKVLAHELGHVKFIVPRLDQYIEYCRIRYHQKNIEVVVIDHQASDMGSNCVFEFERRYRKAYRAYSKQNGKNTYNPKVVLRDMEDINSIEQLLLNPLAKMKKELK